MDITSVIRLSVLLLITKGIFGSNTPPTLSSDKDWRVQEDDPVGTRVTTLVAKDNEGDNVSFSLEGSASSPDIHRYFRIRNNKRVEIARPLRGLAGESGSKYYLVRVRLSDGSIPTIVEVRLQVSRRDDHGEHAEERDNIEGPPGLVGGFPSIERPYRAHPPAFINYPGPNVFGTNHQSSSGSPPFIKIKERNWAVNYDAPVGQFVASFGVDDLTGEGYNLTLAGARGLLSVDRLGTVRVAESLKGQVQDLPITIIASSGRASSSEVVVLHVVRPPQPTPPRPTPPSPTPSIPFLATTDSSSTSTLKTSDDGNNSQDLRVVSSSSGGSGITGSSTDTATEAPREAPEADISLTIIPIVLVAGISPVALALYCYWRRIQNRKALAETKESAVVYSEKGEEATATQVAPRRGAASITQTRNTRRIGFSSLFQGRAQSNKYEDDLKGGNGQNKRKMSEISAPIGDTWEFPRHHLKFMGILGEGCFGQVWKCEAVGIKGKDSMLVAVKTLKESAGERERRDLVQELKVLKNLGHHINVVSLLGCCTEKDPILIILEYMIGGKLQSFLRASRADANYSNLHGASSSITPRDLTLFAYQTARGMEFLARNGIIHRDLAARNVLVGEDKVCKVADFGFARDVANNRVYERKSDGRLPIRWMAPESLFDNIFTTKSDVWSFGVLLWEIVTLGSTPYPGLGASEVMKKVKDGYRLEKPDHCRREIYNIMYYCWDKDAKERPSFTELVHTLENLLLTEVEYIELDRFPDHTYYNVITEKSDELL